MIEIAETAAAGEALRAVRTVVDALFTIDPIAIPLDGRRILSAQRTARNLLALRIGIADVTLGVTATDIRAVTGVRSTTVVTLAVGTPNERGRVTRNRRRRGWGRR